MKFRICRDGNGTYWVEEYHSYVHPECNPYWLKVYFIPYSTFGSEKEAQKRLDHYLRSLEVNVVKEIYVEKK